MLTIEANGLKKSYGNTIALDNISFQVNKGEIFGFIGPDGAGKTSLFRIIATVLLADEGTIKIEDLDVVKDYKQIRKIVGYMPGRFSLYQDLTVHENLKFYATIFGTTIEENYELIKDIYIQIEPFSKRRAGKLSGGMKQKLALCCAMIHKPHLLILDEPTTGVDAVSRQEFWMMLRKYKEAGITVLVSTPYMDEASLCDRVALIQSGKIMTIDTPENITNSYGDILLSIRADNMYKLHNEMKAFPKTKTVNTFGDSLHFSSLQDEISFEEIEIYLSDKGHQNIEIKEIKPNIEDCFMKLMNINND